MIDISDISHLLALPEYRISREFQTEFNWDKDLPDQLPISLGEHVNAKTNGDINLIYVDGTYVAINTSSRDIALARPIIYSSSSGGATW